MKRESVLHLVVITTLCLYVGVAYSKPKTKPKPPTPDSGDYVIKKRSDGTTVKYKRSNRYDFEGANIDGLYNKPAGAYISNIKDIKGRSAIKIREHFDGEVADSVRQLK